MICRDERVARVFAALLFVACGHTAFEPMTAPADPKGEKETAGQKTHRASGRTDVKSYSPTTFDEMSGAPSLMEVQVTETFSGDIQGEGTARVVQAARRDGSASFAGMERVRGSIAGRSGSFLLAVSGTVAGKDMQAQWSVVSGSGTDGLKGLRGQGGFEAKLGDHGAVWLDYSFE
jgi:hypothetical protein